MYLRKSQYEEYPSMQGVYIVEKPEWLTTAQAADIMGITAKTIADYCRDGKLECRKWGRDWQVSRESAEQFKKSNAGRPKKDET